MSGSVTRVLHLLPFLGLAAGMHLAVLGLAPVPQGGGAADGGAGGTATLTVAGASPAVVAALAEAARPPQVATPAHSLSPPEPFREVAMPPRGAPPAPVRQESPNALAAPRFDAAARPADAPAPLPPVAPARIAALGPAPAPDTSVAAAVAPSAVPRAAGQARLAAPPEAGVAPPAAAPASLPPRRPAHRPERLARSTPQSDAPAMRAHGAAGAPRAAAQEASAPALTSGARQSLLADWGGRIRAQVERARRAAPPGMRGRAVVALTLAADGALAGVRIAQSSGAAAVDNAALDAVRGAVPFPAAPEALGTGPFAFNLPVRFGG